MKRRYQKLCSATLISCLDSYPLYVNTFSNTKFFATKKLRHRPDHIFVTTSWVSHQCFLPVRDCNRPFPCYLYPSTVSKWVCVQNLSYENELDLYENWPEGGDHLHMKDFASQRLTLTEAKGSYFKTFYHHKRNIWYFKGMVQFKDNIQDVSCFINIFNSDHTWLKEIKDWLRYPLIKCQYL